MERSVLIAAAVIAVLAVAGIYFAIKGNGGNGNGQYAGVALGVEPAGTAQFPQRNCYMGAEPVFGGNGVRVQLAADFLINNYGKELLNGSSVFLIFNNEVVAEARLNQSYANGTLLFDGKREFSFLREFHGAEYSVDRLKRIYSGDENFEYKLAYCNGCVDPVQEGFVFYSNTTQFCCKVPSTMIGSAANSCS